MKARDKLFDKLPVFLSEIWIFNWQYGAYKTSFTIQWDSKSINVVSVYPWISSSRKERNVNRLQICSLVRISPIITIDYFTVKWCTLFYNPLFHSRTIFFFKRCSYLIIRNLLYQCNRYILILSVAYWLCHIIGVSTCEFQKQYSAFQLLYKRSHRNKNNVD